MEVPLQVLNGEDKIKTVDEEDIDFFHFINSLETSKEDREFFKCSCNHNLVEHEKLGKCRRRSCDCMHFFGDFNFIFSRREVLDKYFWKAIEEFNRKNLKGIYNASKNDESYK